MLLSPLLPIDVTSVQARQTQPKLNPQGEGFSFKTNLEQQVKQQQDSRQDATDKAAEKNKSADSDKPAAKNVVEDKVVKESHRKNEHSINDKKSAHKDDDTTAVSVDETNTQPVLKVDTKTQGDLTQVTASDNPLIDKNYLVDAVSSTVLPDVKPVADNGDAIPLGNIAVTIPADAEILAEGSNNKVKGATDAVTDVHLEISWFKKDQRVSSTDLIKPDLNIGGLTKGSDNSNAKELTLQTSIDIADGVAANKNHAPLLSFDTILNGMSGDKTASESKAVTMTDSIPASGPSAVLSKLNSLMDLGDSSVKQVRGFHLGTLSVLADGSAQFPQQQNEPSSKAVTNNNLVQPTLAANTSLSPDFVGRLGDQVMWLRHQNINVAELRLHPRDLGSVLVRIDNNGDKTSVNFVAAHHVVRDVLDQNMIKLREMFSDAGLNLVDVQVSGDSQSKDRDLTGSNNSSAFTQSTFGSEENTVGEGKEAGDTTAAISTSIHLVDFFA